ncbi:MAG: hypothetical protein DHS20C13_24180 [Thermodesulfobacteriota bacterium]|nr:MAG: hypothetical protein DHS20C13_24180 [Thermodesulfobacteriota bacterium]
MGLFNFLKNINKLEGARIIARRDYDAYLKKALRGEFPNDDPPHFMALYGALGNFKQRNKLPIVEANMWIELTPFLAMSENDSIEALVEYIVYLDRHRFPDEYPNIKPLSSLINTSLANVSGEIRDMAILGVLNHVGWCELLDNDLLEQLSSEANRLR